MNTTATRLKDRLELIFKWYRRMIDERSGRLLYLFFPDRGAALTNGGAIRNIASVWDVEILSKFLGERGLQPLIDRSLEYYCTYLTARNGYTILSPRLLGEPSGIAHSAFMIMALLYSNLDGKDDKIIALADGIVKQQRKRDGSYKIYFGPEEDDGLELYPAEAMLALLATYRHLQRESYLKSVEHGFLYYKEQFFEKNSVRRGSLIFFANWQSQCGRLLFELTQQGELKNMVRDYLFRLYDRILLSGFHERVQKHPSSQVSVEVACALEGLNDAYSISFEENDERTKKYAEGICIFLSYLLELQCVTHCASREKGGFGLSFTDRTQRIDVTGHVVNGFIKTLNNQIECLHL